MRRWGLLFCLAGCFCLGWVSAVEALTLELETNRPHLAFLRLSVRDGLSQATVFAILQDRQGFLWLGTADGLNRYDGHGFRTFRPRAGEEAAADSLGGRLISALVEDAAGGLWVATDGGGLSHFDPLTERFTTFRHDPQDPESLGSDFVISLAIRPDGDLWVGTRDAGVHCLRLPLTAGLAGARFERFFHRPDDPCSLPSNLIPALWEDGAGRLWVATDHGLARLEQASATQSRPCFNVFRHDAEDASSLSDDAVTELLEDRQGRLWVGTMGGLNLLEEEGSGGPRFRRYLEGPATGTEARSLAGNRVWALHEDADGSLWVGTLGAGLGRLDPATGRLARYRRDLLDSSALASDTIRALFEDREGNLWIGTEQGGLAGLPRMRRYFGNHRQLVTADGPQPLRGIFSLHADGEERVWIGTRDLGLFRLDRQTGEAVEYRLGAAGTGLDSNRILAITGGRAGEVVLGTAEGGLFRVETASGRLEPLRPGSARADAVRVGGSVRALLRDEEGTLWVGTWRDGLHAIALDGGPRRVFRHDPENPASLAEDVVISLGLDSAGSLWIGTWGAGLGRLDRQDRQAGIFHNHRHDPQDPTSLGSDRIACIFEDSRRRLWVCTEAGLDRLDRDRLDRQAGRFQRVTALAGSVVYALAEDGEGRLWLSGNAGLWRFDPDSDRLVTYAPRHGLQGPEFNVGAVARSPRGELLFGGIDGLNLFDPRWLEPATAGPAVVLTQLQAGSRVFEGAQLLPAVSSERAVFSGEIGAVELAPEERSLAIAFAGLDLADPGRALYSYRLEGGRHRRVGPEDGWSPPGAEATARYTDLPAGRYTFRVRAAGGDGLWNLDGAALRFVIEPTLWERPWLRGLAVLALSAVMAASGVGWQRVRHRHLARLKEEELEAKRRLLEAREQERLLFAQEIHDGPLQSVHALQLQRSRPGLSDPQLEAAIDRNLRDLAEELRAVSTRLRSPVLQAFGLEAAIRDHARRFAVEHPEVTLDLDLDLDLDRESEESGESLPDAIRLVLFRIYQEALTNAVRHGAPSGITVGLRLPEPGDGRGRREVVLTVEDDGAGFLPPRRWIELARQGHLGILGMMERAESVAGRLEIMGGGRPGDRPGTRVRVTVPLK